MEQLISASARDAMQEDQDFPALPQNDKESTSHKQLNSDPEQEQVAQVTLKLLASSVPADRADAARELGILRCESAVTHLMAAMFDPAPEVCRAASEALAQIGYERGDVPVFVVPEMGVTEDTPPVLVDETASKTETEPCALEVESVSIEELNAAFADSFGDLDVRASSSDVHQGPNVEVIVGSPLIDDEEFQAEAAAIRQAEHELALRRAEVAAKQRAKEESARLAQIEALKSKAEAEARHRSELEEQINSELEKIRCEQTDQLKRLQQAEAEREAQDEARRMFEADADRFVEENERRLEEFQVLKEARAFERARRTEKENELRAELQQLEAASDEQKQLLELATVSVSTKQESLKKLEAQVQETADAEELLSSDLKRLRNEELAQQDRIAQIKKSLVQLEEVRSKTAAETVRNEEGLNELNSRISELTKLQAVQHEQVARAESRLEELENDRQQSELSLSKCKETEAQTIAALEDLKQSELEALDRIEKLQERISELQAATQANQQELAELEVRERDARKQYEQESGALESLREALGTLKQEIAEQAERIAEYEKEGQQAQLEANALAENEKQIKVELKSLRETTAKSRQLAESFRQEVASELKLQAEQKEQQLNELNSLREKAQQDAKSRLEREAQLRAELESLDTAAKDEVDRLKTAEARHRTLQEEATLRAAQLRQLSAEEDSRRQALLELEAKMQFELEERVRVEKEIKANIEDLRQEIATRAEQIDLEKVRAEHEKAELAELEATLSVAMESATQRAQKEQQLTIQIDELDKSVVEHAERIALAAKELELKKERESQLKIELETLTGEVKVQSRLVEEATGVLQKLKTEGEQHCLEQKRLQEAAALEIENQRQKAEALRQEFEAESRLRLEKEAQRVAAFETQRKTIEESIRQLFETTQQFETEIELLRKEEREQQIKLSRAMAAFERVEAESKLLAAEEARVNQEHVILQAKQSEEAAEELRQELERERVRRAQEEESRIAQLEELRRQAEHEASERAERERFLQQQIASYRLVELSETERLQRLEDAVNTHMSEIADRQRAEEQLRAQEESRRQEDLERMRSAAEVAARRNNEIEQKLKSEMAQLRNDEENQLKRIDALRNQLNEIRESELRLTEDEARMKLQAALQLAEVESRARAEATNRLGDLEARMRELEEQSQKPTPEVSFDLDALLAQTKSETESDRGPQTFEIETNDFETVKLEEFEDESNAGFEISADDSFIIVEIEDESEVVPDPVIETFSKQEPEAFIKHELSIVDEPVAPLSQSIDLVREEKGIMVAGDEGSVPGVLLVRLKSDDPDERKAALFELSQYSGDEAFALVSRAFDDSSIEVRNAAAHALYELDRDRAASFTRALREGTPERRRRIGAAMGGSGIALEAINNLVGESREKTYDAFSILFLMAKAGEIQPLVRSIEGHADVNVRLAVISLLTFSNQPETIPAFRRLAVRGSLPAEVRSALMEAIHQVSTQNRETAAA